MNKSQRETKQLFDTLFEPLKLEGHAIRYEFLLRGKGKTMYQVKYNKKKSNHILLFGSSGRGWLVAKLQEDNWMHQKVTKAERERIIEFCRSQIKKVSA